jgi:Spy/CpxP family protein refolding chaperone
LSSEFCRWLKKAYQHFLEKSFGEKYRKISAIIWGGFLKRRQIMIAKAHSLVCFVCLALLSAGALAHGFGPRGQPWGYFRIPDLTDKQKSDMDELWSQYLKEVLLKEADLRKAEAELQVALASESPDTAKIDNILSTINALKGEIFSRHVHFVLQIKKLLNPAQAKWFSMELISNPHLILQRHMMDVPRQEGGFQGGMPQGPQPPPMPPQGIQGGSCEQAPPPAQMPAEPKKRAK